MKVEKLQFEIGWQGQQPREGSISAKAWRKWCILVSHQKAEFTHCTPPGGTLYLDVCECHPFDCHRPEVSNLQCATWFCYWNTATSIHLWVADFTLQQQRWVFATEIVMPAKPKIVSGLLQVCHPLPSTKMWMTLPGVMWWATLREI